MASSTDSDSDYADFSSDDEAATASHVDVEPANPPSLSRQITGQMCPSDVTSIMQLASRLLMKAAVASVFVNTCTAQKVDHVHSILSIPKEECRLFLEFLRWDDELVQAKFLDSEAEVRHFLCWTTAAQLCQIHACSGSGSTEHFEYSCGNQLV